jgi:hypothetical protein
MGNSDPRISAKQPGSDVSPNTQQLVLGARHSQDAEALVAQADWHEPHGHPLAEIIAAPGGASWSEAE